jgi:bifunctional non-homologous end joining protein LigD
VTWEELGSVRGADDLRFAPDEVLARVDEFGDLARDLLSTDAPPLPDESQG